MLAMIALTSSAMRRYCGILTLIPSFLCQDGLRKRNWVGLCSESFGRFVLIALHLPSAPTDKLQSYFEMSVMELVWRKAT